MKLSANRIQTLLKIENPSKSQLDMLARRINHHVKLRKHRAAEQSKTSPHDEQTDKQSARSDKAYSNKKTPIAVHPPVQLVKNVVEKRRTTSVKIMSSSGITDCLNISIRCVITWINVFIIFFKSYQIDATYYFAGEVLEQAILTGDNQIFLSASRAQAEVFRRYIVALAKEFLNLELSANPMTLSNGTELHFLSTNVTSKQQDQLNELKRLKTSGR